MNGYSSYKAIAPSHGKRFLEIVLLPFSQFLNLVIGAFLPPFVIKYIGKESYGFVAMAVGLGSFTLLSQLSVPISCTRYISIANSRGRRDASPILSNALLLSLFSAIAALLVFAWAFWNINTAHATHQISDPFQHRYTIAVIGLSYMLFMLLSPYQSVMQAHEKFIGISLVQVGTSAIRVALIVLVLPQVTAGLVAYSTIYALIVTLPMVAYFFLNTAAADGIPVHISDWSREKVGLLLRHGGTMTINSLLWQMMTTFNFLMIGWLKGPTYVTYLALALVWSNLTQSVSDSVNQLLLPAAARHEFHEQKQELRSMGRISSKLLFMVMMPLFAYLIVFGRYVVTAWLGPGFEVTAKLLPLVLIAEIFTTINSPVASMVSTMSLSKVIVGRNLRITPILFLLQIVGVAVLGFGLMWVVAVSLVNSVIRGVYTYGTAFSKFVDERYISHLREIYGMPLIAFAFASLLLSALASLCGEVKLTGLVLFTPVAVVVSWGTFFFVALSRGERAEALRTGARVLEKTRQWFFAKPA